MQNVQQTIVAQYAAAPVITALIESINACVDPSADINNFYTNIFNIATASGYGLDVWGRILGVGRVLHVASVAYFGFAESTTAVGFGQGPFLSGNPITTNYALADTTFRQLLFAKAMANIADGSIRSINAILMSVFGSEGTCYCTDGLNMTMTYTFNFTPSPVDLAIIQQSGVLPRPSGVALSIVHS